MSRIDDSYGSVNTSPQNQRPPGPSLQQQGQLYGPGAGPRFADSPRSFGPSGQPPRRRGRVSRTNTKGGGGQRPDTGEAQAHGGAGPTAAQSRNPQTPKKTSANKSDILSRECFVLEGMGFHQLTISDMVSPEMLGLNGLIDSMYVKLNSTNTYFSKHVTKSVFSYYCCVFAYAHLLRLAQHSGDTLTMAELSFVDFIDGSSFLLPEPLSLYLSAFGKTFLSSGTNLRFRLAPHSYVEADGIPGFFGAVNADTHYLYGAYPCLGVSVKRILADMARGANDPPDWDLPGAVRPATVEGVDFGHPTENMVGYGSAVFLRRSQRTWLENLGIHAGAFPSTNGTLPLNAQLLEAVSSSLHECKAFKFAPAVIAKHKRPAFELIRTRLSPLAFPSSSAILNCAHLTGTTQPLLQPDFCSVFVRTELSSAPLAVKPLIIGVFISATTMSKSQQLGERPPITLADTTTHT